MKIIVEANIPYIKGLLEAFGEVEYLPAAEINAETVKEADALFVRTRTRCDSRLLSGSRVRFIATATIGTDHIGLGYCRDNGIAVIRVCGNRQFPARTIPGWPDIGRGRSGARWQHRGALGRAVGHACDAMRPAAPAQGRRRLRQLGEDSGESRHHNFPHTSDR